MADKKKKRLVFRSVMLAIMLSAVGFALYSSFTKGSSEQIQVGDEAPNFKLETVNVEGKEHLTLDEFEGKGVMINFWATYCPPCKEEMPYMQTLYPEYKEKGVEIIAVNLDQGQLVVDKFLNNYDLTFPIVQDSNGQVMELYDVGNLPATYFVGPDGKIEHKVIGALTLDRIEGYMKDITPQS
ncbi:thiol-disulfide oxidoreductase ResA [Pontibacillus salicampi]|uniref:Thiol-disulfide oxidoreductase ResA n=1 Tax=Pontibacillus salicampi TaxID=1449801 RepID=A0ABV6LL37_9BACI